MSKNLFLSSNSELYSFDLFSDVSDNSNSL
jgi:hypothetical protein